jgi:hypothetical protein
VPAKAAKHFLIELQREAFENVEELLGEISAAAQRLWTSLKILS